MQSMVESAFARIGTGGIFETLPKYLLDEFQFPNLETTLRTLHTPPDLNQVAKAQLRIKFEELF